MTACERPPTWLVHSSVRIILLYSSLFARNGSIAWEQQLRKKKRKITHNHLLSRSISTMKANVRVRPKGWQYKCLTLQIYRGPLHFQGFETVDSYSVYRVARKSKSLSQFIIKSYKIASEAIFYINTEHIKWTQECYEFVFSILCLTCFVKSAVALFGAAWRVKSMCMTKKTW